MKQKIQAISNHKSQISKKAVTKTKANRLEELDNFREQLALLVALQKNAILRANESEEPAMIHMDRLCIYDRFVRMFVTSFERLATTLSATQPGGAPRNPNREIAFQILTECYCTNNTVLTAKKLVKQVLATLPIEQRKVDPEGREPFSERIAGEEIRDFKALLRTAAIDSN
jgi:hypothetical protein